VVFWRLRYKLSLRDLPEMFVIRGIEFSDEAVRDREARLSPSLIDSSRRRRKGRIGKSWYVDVPRAIRIELDAGVKHRTTRRHRFLTRGIIALRVLEAA
jgi:transposase-like protein